MKDNAATSDRSRRARALATIALAVALALSGERAAATEVSVTVTDTDGAPLEHAVVALTAADGGIADSKTPTLAVMEQRNQAFQPHVITVARGSRVRFPNLDDTQHHVYSFSPAKVFDLPLFKGEEPPPVTFDQPGLVTVGCNIHDHMRGYILVTDAAAQGVTGPDGTVTLTTDLRGTVELSLWHERALQPVPGESLRLVGPPLQLTRQIGVSPPPEPVKRGLRAWVSP